MNVLSSFSGKVKFLVVAALLMLALLPLMGDTRAQSGGPGPGEQAPVDPQALQRLLDDSRGKAQVSVSDATQTVNFVRRPSEQDGTLFLPGRTPAEKAISFFESLRQFVRRHQPAGAVAAGLQAYRQPGLHPPGLPAGAPGRAGVGGKAKPNLGA